jgi:hypothetical protein
MKPTDSEPILKLAFHGIPERSAKTMRLFFQQIPTGITVIDAINKADIHFVDMDYKGSDNILADLQQYRHQSVFVITSLTERNTDPETIFLKKPLTKEAILTALKQSRTQLAKQQSKTTSQTPETSTSSHKSTINELEKASTTPRQQSAEQFNEKRFSHFVGVMTELDSNNPEQIAKASFSPKDYFLGVAYNAIKTAHHKKKVLELKTDWKPLIIFPHSREIWLGATDHQLRAFAGLKVDPTFFHKVSLSPANIRAIPKDKQEKRFQSEESFLWKLALWTSKGRYPISLPADKPITLKHWPNLTQLIFTPHALRICALLTKQPQSMLDVAKTLKIGPQYVFAFITACSALNLIVQVTKSPTPKKVIQKKNHSLLNKLLSKLRTKTDNDTA